ncbi:MAG: DNA helicase RecQ [Phycisphaerales bacterium]|nr:MAG: DNA helicase RecQ [Phycisphaerales bacterium]
MSSEQPKSTGTAVRGAPDEAAPSGVDPRILEALRQYWGYETLRPHQREAIEAGLANRDSLVVMPTGGGKSLCYQIPPLIADRMDVVISPLISLMKDQVDGLRQSGYPAAAIHSSITPAEREELRDAIRDNRLRLLFVSPERLMTPAFLDFLGHQQVRAFSIDEAHCISQWGHDFRQEYRQLAVLRERFPEASIHAYTATATERVRKDIVEQLGLRNPKILVGTFDRPNLVYRIQPATDVHSQTLEIVKRHENEAAIVYCISRKDTEAMAGFLQENGVKAAAYHAGLEKSERSLVQESFANETLDVVAATVAFGMGIDRSDVRCVIHAAMPKTIENYQQETGRAGRDGLEAECVLLFTYGDVMKWKRLIKFSAENAPDPGPIIATQEELLNHMAGFCASAECRHLVLSRYFGQTYPKDNCGACDVCLDELDTMDGATEIAQKILSCVYRVGQSFGVSYVIEVLRGSQSQKVLERGHDQLSTHGLLREMHEKTLRNLIFQLIDQGLLVQTQDDRPVLKLCEASLAVLRGEREVALTDPGHVDVKSTGRSADEWAGVDRELFETLREVRRDLAAERDVPAFVVFNDATLREMARMRPTTRDSMAKIPGVGKKKLAELGPRFIEAIRSYCEECGLSSDVEVVVPPKRANPSPRPNAQRQRALEMFRQGASIEAVAQETGRAESTICRYLEDWLEAEPRESLEPWVDHATYSRVMDAARELHADRLAPIYEALNGEVPYSAIRLVLSHARVQGEISAGEPRG